MVTEREHRPSAVRYRVNNLAFIVPALYERYQNSTPKAIDEYTLSQAQVTSHHTPWAKLTYSIGAAELAEVMEEHYKTFIVSPPSLSAISLTLQTEKDFADIAAAGLNWVRIPIGYWAIETQDDEPFLEGVSWK